MDLCRQSLVFDDVAGVAACLAAVRADPEARVLRVKNRLDPGYDAGLSAGYRDVAVNVRVETAASAALGVDGHVCELQLTPRTFAEAAVTLDAAPPSPSRSHIVGRVDGAARCKAGRGGDERNLCCGGRRIISAANGGGICRDFLRPILGAVNAVDTL